MPLPSYNVTATPRRGVSAYGMVPGQIATPPSRFQGVAGVAPIVPELTQAVGQNIQSAVGGNLSGGTIRQLQQQAAERAVGSGMPWTGTGNTQAGNRYLNSIAGASEALTHQGTQDYLSFLGGIASTVDNPELQAGIADRNATMAAAPDPRAKSDLELSLLQKYMGNPAGGTGGGLQPKYRTIPGEFNSMGNTTVFDGWK